MRLEPWLQLESFSEEQTNQKEFSEIMHRECTVAFITGARYFYRSYRSMWQVWIKFGSDEVTAVERDWEKNRKSIFAGTNEDA